jgi:Ca2+-binding EF-hand superfamily protein
MKEEKIKLIYDYFNESNKEGITLAQFKSKIPDISDEDWSEFLKRIDSNQDGNVSLEEFRDYLIQLL